MRGRCPCYGNGAMEIVEGLNSFIAGIGGTVAADASGVACVASGVTLTITAEGVVTIVDGGYTIYNGVVAIQGDSRQYRDAKGADRKASEGGSSFTSQNQMYLRNSNNTVMAHIGRLREKLNEPSKNPKFIKTVWGVGYEIE